MEICKYTYIFAVYEALWVECANTRLSDEKPGVNKS